MRLFIPKEIIWTACFYFLRVTNAEGGLNPGLLVLNGNQTHDRTQTAKSCSSCSGKSPVTKSQRFDPLKPTNEPISAAELSTNLHFLQGTLIWTFLSTPLAEPRFGVTLGHASSLVCRVISRVNRCHHRLSRTPRFSAAYGGEARLQRGSVWSVFLSSWRPGKWASAGRLIRQVSPSGG